MPIVPNLSEDRKQYRCKKCFCYHDLYYLVGIGNIVQLAYNHPTPRKKKKLHDVLIIIKIPNLPIPSEESKELRKQNALLRQGSLFEDADWGLNVEGRRTEKLNS